MGCNEDPEQPKKKKKKKVGSLQYLVNVIKYRNRPPPPPPHSLEGFVIAKLESNQGNENTDLFMSELPPRGFQVQGGDLQRPESLLADRFLELAIFGCC